MSDSYKYSYKMGEDFLNSLSVYNVGYQKCEPEYQWGPGIRDHYCIHHILSGSGVYTTGKVSVRLSAGDTFILFPGVELQYQADKEEPWEYCWDRRCIYNKKYRIQQGAAVYFERKDPG